MQVGCGFPAACFCIAKLFAGLQMTDCHDPHGSYSKINTIALDSYWYVYSMLCRVLSLLVFLMMIFGSFVKKSLLLYTFTVPVLFADWCLSIEQWVVDLDGNAVANTMKMLQMPFLKKE